MVTGVRILIVKGILDYEIYPNNFFIIVLIDSDLMSSVISAM